MVAFVAGAGVAGALLAGQVPGAAGVPSRKAAARDRDRYATLDAFAQSLSYIVNEYVDEVDERDLLYAAIGGMVHTLDKHSAFLSPRRYQRLREDTEGEFGGVGFELGEPPEGATSPYPVVEGLIAGSPADRAGINDGDRVVEIDGHSLAPDIEASSGGDARPAERADAADALRRRFGALLRGPAGTRLELAISPAASTEVEHRTLVRERVKVPTVTWMALPHQVGYLAIRRFQEATATDCEAALRALRGKLGGHIGVLMVDLRGNPGGLYDQAVRVADLFLADGVIVKVSSRGGRIVETETAHRAGTWAGFPMLVLVDQGSASAAEIVAGALQDHARAALLGLPTYGKGSVQTFLDLPDGSGLKLTTARYFTPRGRSLEGSGIQPDIQVEAFEPEVIRAGSGGRSTQGSRLDAPRAGERGAIDAKIPPGLSDQIRQKLEDDFQLRVSYETALSWLKGRGGKAQPSNPLKPAATSP